MKRLADVIDKVIEKIDEFLDSVFSEPIPVRISSRPRIEKKALKRR